MVGNPCMVDNFASVINFMTVGDCPETKRRRHPQFASDDWRLTINVCGQANCGPVFCFLVFLIQITIEPFADRTYIFNLELHQNKRVSSKTGPPPPPPLVILLLTIPRRFLCCSSSLCAGGLYVAFVLSLFVPHLSFFWFLGKAM